MLFIKIKLLNMLSSYDNFFILYILSKINLFISCLSCYLVKSFSSGELLRKTYFVCLTERDNASICSMICLVTSTIPFLVAFSFIALNVIGLPKITLILEIFGIFAPFGKASYVPEINAGMTGTPLFMARKPM